MNAANGTSRFIHRFTFINLFLHYCITCLDESCFSHNREITARLKGSLSIANRNSEPSIVHALAVNKGLPVPFLSSPKYLHHTSKASFSCPSCLIMSEKVDSVLLTLSS